jgi:MFS family permease
MSPPSPDAAVESGQPPPHDPYAALAVPAFRRFVVSLLTMTMASQVQAVVVGWLIYQATRDPLALGLIGLAEVVPYIAVALVAGDVVDRSDRKRISVLALAVLVVASLLLLAFTLRWGGSGIIWPYYAIIGVCGIARSFLQSSRSALVAEIVPRDRFANAATWRSSTWQLGTVLGPALGGVLFAAVGARVTFGINVVLNLMALGAMIGIRHTPTRTSIGADSIAKTLGDGLRFVRGQRIILAALTLDMLAVFFGGAVALMPVFATEILRVGPRGVGALQAAPGVGAVLMAIIVAHRPPFQRAGRALLVAVAVFGISTIAFAVSTSFPLSLALLVIGGAADNISAVIRATLIQVLVPPHMLGRVSAVNAIFIGSSNELGAFESGVAARLLGPVAAVVFGGIMTLAVVSVTAWQAPPLRRMRRIEASPHEHAA